MLYEINGLEAKVRGAVYAIAQRRGLLKTQNGEECEGLSGVADLAASLRRAAETNERIYRRYLEHVLGYEVASPEALS